MHVRVHCVIPFYTVNSQIVKEFTSNYPPRSHRPNTSNPSIIYRSTGKVSFCLLLMLYLFCFSNVCQSQCHHRNNCCYYYYWTINCIFFSHCVYIILNLMPFFFISLYFSIVFHYRGLYGYITEFIIFLLTKKHYRVFL